MTPNAYCSPSDTIRGLLIVIAFALSGLVARAQAPTDAVGLWQLDDGGGTAGDSSGNGNTGVLSGSVWVAGRMNEALAFDGTNDHVQVATPSASMKPMSAFAISAWVKYTATDSHGADVASMGDSHALRVSPAGLAKAFFYNGSGWTTATSAVATNDGTWHHLVAQYTTRWAATS